MKKWINTSESIESSSFSRMLSHMNKFPCGFITAFRDSDNKEDKLSKSDKLIRNQLLESEIKQSNLSFIKTIGGFVENAGEADEQEVTENTFLVIDNKYDPKDFIQLMIKWCSQFEQDAVLITLPDRSTDNPHSLSIRGYYYNKHGDILEQFESISTKNIEEYFTRIGNRKFVMSSDELFETESYDIYGVSGRGLGRIEFGKRYPDLVRSKNKRPF